MLGDSMAQGFDRMFGRINAGTDVVVRSAGEVGTDDAVGRGTLDASVVADVAKVDGVDRAVGSITGLGQIVGSDGTHLGGDGPPTLAGNWVQAPGLNPFTLAEGRAPAAAGEVVIDRGSSIKGHLPVGARTTVLTPAPVPVTVVGVATFGDQDSPGTATYAWFDDQQARELLTGGQDRVSAVLVDGAAGVDPAALRARVQRVLAAGAEALTGGQLTSEQTASIDADFLGMLRTFLLVFSGVAMLVAAFSIHNTFAVVAAQRQRESALLRALGSTRSQVLRSTAVEVLVIGVVASTVGVAVGAGLAVGLQALLSAMGLGVPDDGLVVTATTVLVSILVGVLATALAGLTPALASARVAPLAALREVAVERAPSGPGRKVLGSVLLLAGLVVMAGPAAGWWDGPFLLVGLGAVGTVIGLLVLGPVVAGPVTSVLGAPVRRLRGVTGGLASENAVRNPKRTATTASALVVGVGVVTIFTVFGASLTGYVDASVARSVEADLVVKSESFGGAGLPPGLAGELAHVPGVATAAALGWGHAAVQGAPAGERDLDVTVADPAQLAQVVDVGRTRGAQIRDLHDRQVLVSEDLAAERGWHIGSTVDLGFPDGATEPFTLAGTYEHTDVVEGVLMATAAWDRHTSQPMSDMVLVGLSPGADLEHVRAGVDRVSRTMSAPAAMDHRQFVDDAAGEVGKLLAMIYVLLALSIVIALMGIANTLSLSVMERTRELGLLRAVGQTRGQVRAMVRWEAVLIAVFGTVLGLALGVVSGWALVGASVGSEIDGVFRAPAAPLAVIALVGAGAGVLAGLRPAARAARLDVLGAIATA
jgi:putative ABC transport system permease protein